MFKNTYQNGLLSIFFSCGANPLAIWDTEVKNGHIKRLTDKDVNSIVLEIVSTNVATTYMTCPKDDRVLGIKLPFLVMIIKNLKRYFSFEIVVLDDKNMRRRFRISNFQSTTKIKPFCTSMPIGLAGGWNQIQFNLADFTRRAYGTRFIETLRVQVHANARIRRIYFSEKLFTEEELPQEYKLYLPLERKQKKVKAEPATPQKTGLSTKSMAVMSKKSSVAATPINEEKPQEEVVKVEVETEATTEAPAEGEIPPDEVAPPVATEEAQETPVEQEELAQDTEAPPAEETGDEAVPEANVEQ